MTIVLPFPTPQGQNLADNDAGNGVNPTPIGAPEGMATSTFNDVDRYDKTAIRQNTDNILAINAAIGTMAEQDADSVNITGGNIDAAVTVAEAVNATQFGGLTLQALYDLIYPIGKKIEIMNTEEAPPTWPGTASTWALTSEGLFLKPIMSGQTVGETFAGVTETDATVLTEAQIPAHDHDLFADNVVTSSNTVNQDNFAAVQLNEGTDDDYVISDSSDQSPTAFRGKTNSVGSGQGHTHTFDDNPPFQRVAVYVRTA